MTPVLQLDPLSLAIWMRRGGFGRDARGQSAAAALRAAWAGGDFAAAVQSAAATRDDAKYAAWIGSCMWHEKRHFFDLCLTSYGAWRLRNMFVIAANSFAVGGHAMKSGEPLVLPVTAYADPFWRDAMGLAEPPDNVLRIARDTAQRQRALFDESAPLRAGDQALRLDGTAQMEGLALLSQFHCLAGLYGGRAASEIYSDQVNRMRRDGVYRWVELLSMALGCARSGADGRTELDHELATALMVGGLCGRWLGTGRDETTTKPSERLGRLMAELGPRPGRFGMTTEEASALVDDAAHRIWGRRLWEELDADLEESQAVGEMLRREFGGLGDLCAAFDDYLDLRGRMLAEIRSGGPAAMSPRAFGKGWAARLRPWLLEVNPVGRTYDPSNAELHVHFGRRVEHPIFGTRHVAWAWRVREAPESDTPVELCNAPAWSFVVEKAAPMAKLALMGRRHELMLDPELDGILDATRDAGIDIRFLPAFQWPESRDLDGRRQAARSVAELERTQSFVCDITGDPVAVEDACLLSPWEFRRSPLLDRFRERAGKIPGMAEMKLATDWSAWIVRADLLG